MKACHAPVCGGSSLVHTDAIRSLSAYAKENRSSIIGGHVTAPVSMENDYGGFWFYSQHLIQMMTEVFGTDVISVTAQKESQGVRAVYRYAQFCVTAFFGTGYTISLYRGGYDAVSATITLGEDYFLPELHAFYKMVKTGRIADRLQDLIAPVFLIDATITAYEKNREVYVHIPNV